jgi:hypothetical protein
LRFIYLGNHKNHPHLFVLIHLLLIVMSNIAVAQDDLDINEMRRNAQQALANPQQLKYQIVDIQENDGIFTIKYDLDGPNKNEYSVKLVLFKESDSRFSLKPKTITGDIGQGKYSGIGKTIIWNSKKDLDNPLKGNDYYFVLYITKVEPSRFPWLWVGIGGVAAGAAILLISNKPGSESTPDLPAIGISRPN